MVRFRLLHPPCRLDPSSDFLREPPDLAGFDNFCKEYLLVKHRQYVVVREKGRYDLHGAWRVVFRCLGHTLCAGGQGMEYDAVLRDGCVFFGERSDRTHMGDMKKVGGLTVPQWYVLRSSGVLSVPEALSAFDAQGVGQVAPRLLERKILELMSKNICVQDAGMNPIRCIGTLSQFLEDRSRDALLTSGRLRDASLVCMNYQGVDALSTFMVAFTMEAWMKRCASLEGLSEGLDVYADGKHKFTRTGALCDELQSDGDDDVCGEDDVASGSSSDSSSGAEVDCVVCGFKRKKKKTDAMVVVSFGYKSARYVSGRATQSARTLRKFRPSFSPLGICFVLGKESVDAYRFVMQEVMKYAATYHPGVAAHLRSVSSATSDFSRSCQNAFVSEYGAVRGGSYVLDEGVLMASSPCLLVGCEEHALQNLTGAGGTGLKKLCDCGEWVKDAIASRLYSILRFMHRRLEIVLFDVVAFYLLKELRCGTVPYVGKQCKWAQYYEKRYLLREDVGGVCLYDAIWRSGSCRSRQRSSNNITESWHDRVNDMVRKVGKSVPGFSSGARVSFPNFVGRFESAYGCDLAMRADVVDEKVYQWPVQVDENLLWGHETIRNKTRRLSVREYLSDGRASQSQYLYREHHGPWLYLVMSAECGGAGRHEPGVVDLQDASWFISLLRLLPDKERHEGFFMRKGILVDGHFSWSRFCAYWHQYAVVRVDTRRIEACKRAPALWGRSVVCLTACDEFLNCRQCEHHLVGRCVCGDVKASPFPCHLTIAQVADWKRKRSVSAVGRPSGQGVRGDTKTPKMTVDEELQASFAQEQYAAMSDSMKSLRNVSSKAGVRVSLEGGDRVTLRKAQEALYHFSILSNVMQQHLLLGTARLDWKRVAADLFLVQVLRVYGSHHPVSRVQGRAAEVQDQLRALLDGTAAMHPSLARGVLVGGGRCHGQQSFARVDVPESCMAAMRDFCSGLGHGAGILLLLGYQAASGYLVTELLQPSVDCDMAMNVVVKDSAVCFGYIAGSQLVLLGIAFCRRELAACPLSMDLREFGALVTGGCGQRCGSRCNVIASVNSKTQRFFTVPLHQRAGCHDYGSAVPTLLQWCTFLRCVNDSAPASAYRPTVLKGCIISEVHGRLESHMHCFTLWLPVYELAMTAFIQGGGAFRMGIPWGVHEFICGLVASAYDCYGPAWYAKVFIAWPWDSAMDVEFFQRSLGRVRELAVAPDFFLLPLRIGDGWFVVLGSAADSETGEWGAVLIGLHAEESLWAIAMPPLKELLAVCNLPFVVADHLGTVECLTGMTQEASALGSCCASALRIVWCLRRFWAAPVPVCSPQCCYCDLWKGFDLAAANSELNDLVGSFVQTLRPWLSFDFD